MIVAEDGVEALDCLFGRGRYADRNPADTPALDLLDIKMPSPDGIEVLQQLRADPRTHLMPVVVLTTSTEEIDLVRAYESGVNAYVREAGQPCAFPGSGAAVGSVLDSYE